ncbi:hypothetical protein PsorP6_000118 [Peronosclerospora sorghi]|uniref:Uncharacterized protein n=1 Tax=Peronosclerospora sorghi TaxID=230839 RepID=A0ACC0WRX5_9STRA|nr:hypothetical protein PsorP6_000118 [Peronosclerospora sorghi]
MMTMKLMHRGLRILLHAISEEETCNFFSQHVRNAIMLRIEDKNADDKSSNRLNEVPAVCARIAQQAGS